MKLPWNQKQEIEELQQEKKELQEKIEALEEDKESFKERFRAEKERRSKLSTQKQEAEEKINKLEQKIQNQGTSRDDSTDMEGQEIEKISFKQGKRILNKLRSIESPENDLLTIYSPQTVRRLSDQQGLKSSISKENFEFLSDDKGFAAFMDEDFLQVKFKMRAFFKPKWVVSDSFDASKIFSFVEKKKKWAAVSAGETTIFEEKDGEILVREEVSSRVDSKQKKGGFSQGRFERKRQEQIDEHLELVEEKIDEDTLLVGEKSLCKKLPGDFLGGFDGDRGSVDALYNFRLVLK
ncbi:Vms1/Ankzf1 family peptidyl-tRNA hydrolase [Candidatus Nanohalobium constans]|uniref:Peptide chain release factor-like protein n=1 Tax=Candidatus Nanohalobium constans TaxID=2565781 RepID=A0A5Q0UGQ4_9ARCH|nr:Vms1/Ankzf1 family peptidyl-tRNA hydrolase [Candidatus Nanohalobium constans]QGA80756.1 peptide chain release factor-like protein [Candidatus Nanohalobium constans]